MRPHTVLQCRPRLGPMVVGLLATICTACAAQPDADIRVDHTPSRVSPPPDTAIAHHRPRSISQIPVPAGFRRNSYDSASFSRWIQQQRLTGADSIVDHAGNRVDQWKGGVLGVVDRPLLFAQDLEQCADFAMHFWADYHRESDRLGDLRLFDYGGRRVSYAGSARGYLAFLKHVFSYSNSHSLKHGAVDVPPDELRPGDLIVQNENGGIGHVSVVMDVCTAPGGEALYLIGFGFMPAQQFHIERAPSGSGIDGWWTLDGFYRYLSEYLDVGTPVLRRFER